MWVVLATFRRFLLLLFHGEVAPFRYFAVQIIFLLFILAPGCSASLCCQRPDVCHPEARLGSTHSYFGFRWQADIIIPYFIHYIYIFMNSNTVHGIPLWWAFGFHKESRLYSLTSRVMVNFQRIPSTIVCVSIVWVWKFVSSAKGRKQSEGFWELGAVENAPKRV